MPLKDFSPDFLNHIKISLPEENVQKFLNSLYTGSTAVYFTAPSSDSIVAKVVAFKKTAAYESLKEQYQLLTEYLNEWCSNNGVLLTTSGEKCFSYHYRVLFDNTTYSGREFLFFNEGKKCLESIAAFLESKNILLDKKKDALKNLQANLLLCADGVFDHIRRATNDLIGVSCLNALIQSTKERLAEQIAISYHIKNNIELLEHQPELLGMQIHYVNTYLKLISKAYGIEVTDNITTSLNGKSENFAAYFFKLFNPKRVIDALIDKLIHIYANLYRDLKEKVFKNSDNYITSEEFSASILQTKLDKWNDQFAEICPLSFYQVVEEINLLDAKFANKVEREAFEDELKAAYLATHAAIKAKFFHANDILTTDDLNASGLEEELSAWNDKYGHILQIEKANFLVKILQEDGSFLYELDSNDFSSFLNDVSLRFKLLPLNETQLKVTIINKFNDSKYLSSPSLPTLFLGNATNSNLKLYYNFENYWIENNQAIEKLTPDLFLKIQIPPQDTVEFIIYWMIYNSLLQDFPSENAPLIATLVNKTSIQYNALVKLFDVPSVVAKMAKARMFALLKFFLDHDLLTQDHLAQQAIIEEGAKANVFWLFCYNNQFDLVKSLLKKPYLKIEHLTQCPSQGYYTGTKALWFLAAHKEFAIIEQLFNKNLLTIEQFEERTRHVGHTRQTILQSLCINKKYDLVEKLLNEKLLPNDQFLINLDRYKDNYLNYHNLPPLVQMVMDEVRLCVTIFRYDHRLTSKIIEQEYEYKGTKINLLIHIVKDRDFALLETLLRKQLITLNQLLITPNMPEWGEFNTTPISLILSDKTTPNEILVSLENQRFIARFGANAIFITTKPPTPANAAATELYEIFKKNTLSPMTTDHVILAIFFACKSSNSSDLKKLLEYWPKLINVKIEHHGVWKTPLHYAVESGS